MTERLAAWDGPSATGPNVGRVFDLSYVLTKPDNSLFPVDGTGSFIEKLVSILREGLVKLRSPHLPHLLHRLLPIRTELKPAGPSLSAAKSPPIDLVDLRFGEHADTRLHDADICER